METLECVYQLYVNEMRRYYNYIIWSFCFSVGVDGFLVCGYFEEEIFFRFLN